MGEEPVGTQCRQQHSKGSASVELAMCSSTRDKQPSSSMRCKQRASRGCPPIDHLAKMTHGKDWNVLRSVHAQAMAECLECF